MAATPSSAGAPTPSSALAAPTTSRKLGADDFVYGSLLGEGAFARVIHCRLRPAIVRDGRPSPDFAAKIMEKRHIRKEHKTAAVMSERNVLTRAAHPNVVRLCYTFQDAEYLYLVMELVRGRELLRLIKACAAAVAASQPGAPEPLQGIVGYRLLARADGPAPSDQQGPPLACSIPIARFYCAQLLNALEYLHAELGVVHRDVKPENVLLSERGHAKLTDFGSSKSEAPDAPPETRQDAFVGTAEYVSPEVLRDESAHAPADLWALGCVLYQTLTGRPPFRGGSEYLTFQQILGFSGPLNVALAALSDGVAAPECLPEGCVAPESERQRLLRIVASVNPSQLVGVGVLTLPPLDASLNDRTYSCSYRPSRGSKDSECDSDGVWEGERSGTPTAGADVTAVDSDAAAPEASPARIEGSPHKQRRATAAQQEGGRGSRTGSMLQARESRVPVSVLRFPRGFPRAARDLILALLQHEPMRRLGVVVAGTSPAGSASPGASPSVQPLPGPNSLSDTAPRPLASPAPASALTPMSAATPLLTPRPGAPSFAPRPPGPFRCGPLCLDYASIRNHPFFEGVDWATVSDPRTVAPVQPIVEPLPDPAAPVDASLVALEEMDVGHVPATAAARTPRHGPAAPVGAASTFSGLAATPLHLSASSAGSLDAGTSVHDATYGPASRTVARRTSLHLVIPGGGGGAVSTPGGTQQATADGSSNSGAVSQFGSAQPSSHSAGTPLMMRAPVFSGGDAPDAVGGAHKPQSQHLGTSALPPLAQPPASVPRAAAAPTTPGIVSTSAFTSRNFGFAARSLFSPATAPPIAPAGTTAQQPLPLHRAVSSGSESRSGGTSAPASPQWAARSGPFMESFSAGAGPSPVHRSGLSSALAASSSSTSSTWSMAGPPSMLLSGGMPSMLLAASDSASAEQLPPLSLGQAGGDAPAQGIQHGYARAATPSRPASVHLPPASFPAKGTSISFTKGDLLSPAVAQYITGAPPVSGASASALASAGATLLAVPPAAPVETVTSAPAAPLGSRPASPLPVARILSSCEACGWQPSAGGALDPAGTPASVAGCPVPAVSAGWCCRGCGATALMASGAGGECPAAPLAQPRPAADAGASASLLAFVQEHYVPGGGVAALAGSGGAAASASASPVLARQPSGASSVGEPAPAIPAGAALQLLPPPLQLDPRALPWWLPLLDVSHGERPIRAGTFTKRKALHLFTSKERELVLTRGGPHGPRLLYLNPVTRVLSAMISLSDPELTVVLRSERGAPPPAPSSGYGSAPTSGGGESTPLMGVAGGTKRSGADGFASPTLASSLRLRSLASAAGGSGTGLTSPFLARRITQWLRHGTAPLTSSPSYAQTMPAAASGLTPQSAARYSRSRARGTLPGSGSKAGSFALQDDSGGACSRAMSIASSASLDRRGGSVRGSRAGSLGAAVVTPNKAATAANAADESDAPTTVRRREKSGSGEVLQMDLRDFTTGQQQLSDAPDTAPAPTSAFDTTAAGPAQLLILQPTRVVRSASFSGPLTPMKGRHTGPGPSGSEDTDSGTPRAEGASSSGCDDSDADDSEPGFRLAVGRGTPRAHHPTPRPVPVTPSATPRTGGGGSTGRTGGGGPASLSSARGRRALSDGDETIPSVAAALLFAGEQTSADEPGVDLGAVVPPSSAFSVGTPTGEDLGMAGTALPSGVSSMPAPVGNTPAAQLPSQQAVLHPALPVASLSTFTGGGALPRERGIIDIHTGPPTAAATALALGLQTPSSSSIAAMHGAQPPVAGSSAHRVFYLLDIAGDAAGWAAVIMAAKAEAIAVGAGGNATIRA